MKYGISGLVTAAVSPMHPRLTPVGRAETNLDGIARQLIRLVVEGHFKSGDRLAPEHELAKQLRVGRSSLREALKALSVVGFLRLTVDEELSSRSGLIISFAPSHLGSGRATTLTRFWK